MEPLKIKNKDSMTDEEKALQKAIKKYTQEAYERMLVNPYEKTGNFLTIEQSVRLTKKEKEMLKDFDFNKIGKLMKACENIA